MLGCGKIIALVFILVWWVIDKTGSCYESMTGTLKTKTLDHIIDNVYLGNWPDSINSELLQKSSIKRILTLNKENTHTMGERAMFKRHGIDYKYIMINDSLRENITLYMNDALKFITKDKGNVFIHCSAGISRSVSVVIAYLMKYKNMSFYDALLYIRSIRPIANPNPGFVKQLKVWELTLN